MGATPTVYDWAQTDFSLYSGSHTGILGALYEKTNQEAILKVDLLATDISGNAAYPTNLIYNPHEDAREVIYSVNTPGMVDLFNTVTNTITASSVSGETKLTVQPDEAVVIVEIPSGATVDHRGDQYFVNDYYISSDRIVVSVNGAENNAIISGKVALTVAIASNFSDEIKQTTITCVDKKITFVDKISLSKNDFGAGSKQMQIKTVTQSGLSDETTLRLTFE